MNGVDVLLKRGWSILILTESCGVVGNILLSSGLLPLLNINQETYLFFLLNGSLFRIWRWYKNI